MRITDTYLQNTFLSSLSQAKKSESDLELQVATQTKVQKTSDNPLSAARISRLNQQIQNVNTYSDNVSQAQDLLNTSTTAMEGMQTETQNIITMLSNANSATNSSTLSSYGQKVKDALQAIVQYANTKTSDGKYVFSGTNTQTAPFDKDATWFGGTPDTSGSQTVRISSSSEQKINFTADEIFQSTLSQNGTLDKTSSVGATMQNTAQIQNADGDTYNVVVTYTKTAANTYSMQYDIKNSGGTVVNTATQQLQFDPTSGKLTSINGTTPSKISINDQTDKISFNIDTSNLSEGSMGALTSTVSQPTNILNTMQDIANELNSGQLPTDAQLKLLNDFNDHILQKVTEAGGVTNRLNDTSDMLQNQQTQLQDMLSKENDTDVAKASIQLQSAQYTTELLYKTSAMILPKSLLDYLS